jgi:hypothetical protein
MLVLDYNSHHAWCAPKRRESRFLAVQMPSSKTAATQAFAGSKPESVGIFIATTTSSKVAVLRTLPEMLMRFGPFRN